MIIILITVITILFFFLLSKNSFQEDTTQQQFLNSTLKDRTTMSEILSDPDFVLLMNNVPGQTVFNISGNPPVIKKSVTQGNPDKIKGLPFSKLIESCDKIIDAINNYISIAKNTEGVYTLERLEAFMLYYRNMINNIIIIKNYILPLK